MTTTSDFPISHRLNYIPKVRQTPFLKREPVARLRGLALHNWLYLATWRDNGQLVLVV